MRARRPLFFVLVLAVLVLIVVGCGGTSSTSSTTAAGGGASTTAPATTGTSGGQSLSGQTLDVYAVWSGTEQKNFKMVSDAFAQQTGAQVQYTSTGDDIAAKLGTAIQGGKPPDIAFLPQPGLMKQYAGKNQLQPLDSVIGSDMGSNYAPVWKELGTVDGKLYGLVFKAANKSTFWYNMTAFKDAGVQPPKTWDELLKVADTLQSFGVAPFSVGGADGWTLTDWFENVYLRTAGAQKYDQLANHQIPWTDPSVKTALTYLSKIWGKSGYVAGGTTGALQTDFPTSVAQVFTSPPKAAMVYEGDFAAAVITGQTKAKLGTDANFFDFPSINGSAPAVVAGGDTAVLMKDSAAGKAFMKFLATPQASEIWAKQGGFSSPNKLVSASAYPDEISARAAQALANTQDVRFDMSDQAPPAFGGTPSKGEWKDLQDFLRNPTNITSTMQKLEADAKAAYGK